jgi:hypothetical protein
MPQVRASRDGGDAQDPHIPRGRYDTERDHERNTTNGTDGDPVSKLPKCPRCKKATPQVLTSRTVEGGERRKDRATLVWCPGCKAQWSTSEELRAEAERKKERRKVAV